MLKLATISANSDDSDIGQIIAHRQWTKWVKEGVITVEDGNRHLKHELDVVEGMQFDRGYLSAILHQQSTTSKSTVELRQSIYA